MMSELNSSSSSDPAGDYLSSPLYSRSLAGALATGLSDHLTPEMLSRARRRLHRKALVIGLWYVGSFLAILLTDGYLSLLSTMSFALALAGVGFNIQHDANHNAFFASSTKRLSLANRIGGWSMYALGADATRWRYRHNILHHSSPNVTGVDSDIDLGPLARFSPDQPHRPWHRYQHYYLWVLYLFTSLEIMFTDISSLVYEHRHPTPRRPRPSLPTWLTAISTKLLALGVLIGLPMLFHPVPDVLLGALLVVFSAGLLLALVFQPAHVVVGSAFNAKDSPRPRFHEAQLASTMDFAGKSYLSRAFSYYAGGLDHQVEHHLFPYLPHTVYPELEDLVDRIASSFSLTRQKSSSPLKALVLHYRHLRVMARPVSPPTGVKY